MRRIRRLAGLGLAVLGLTAPRRVGADVPPPPDSPETKRVPATIELDWGPLAAHVSRRHVVAAGETLRSIAAKELGDASRSKAIAQANPDVIRDPDKIQPGEVLWLPSRASFEPAAPTAPDAAALAFDPWYDAFWAAQSRRPTPLLSGRATPGEVPDAHRAGAVIVLLPHALAARALLGIAKGSVGMEPAESAASLILPLVPDTLVHKDDPTVRIVTKVTVTGREGQVVKTSAERLRYDAAGAVVTKTWVVPPPSYEYARPKADAGAAKDEAPPPPPSPAPTPQTKPAPVAAPGAPADGPREHAAGTPTEEGRWPAWIGLLVAGAGAAAVGVMWAIRRRGTPPTPPPA